MLHPQAEAAIALWSQEPAPGEPGFDIEQQRRTAREAAAAEPREPVADVRDLDADGVPCRLFVPLTTAPPDSSAQSRGFPGGPPQTNRGVVVYLHGGGFVFGDLDTHDAQCRRIANRSGLVVLAVDYRRPPEHRFPAAPQDVDTALAWLHKHGPGLGLDLSRTVAMGDSAGGNLALVAALRNPSRLRALVLVYPFLDPQARFPSYAEENAGLRRDEAAWYWSQYAACSDHLAHPDLAPLESPVLGTLPPTLVVAAEHDVLRDEAEELARRIHEAGGAVRCTTYPGMIHGFWRHPALFDSAEQSLAEIVDFLRVTLP